MKKIILSVVILLYSCFAFAEFKMNPYETYTLKNGMQVFLMRMDEVPLINVRLVLKVGSVMDGENHGIANMTGEALRFGSGKYSKSEIENKLEFLGADLNSEVASESTDISMSFAKKDTQELFPLFSDLILKPKFAKKDFEVYKKKLISQLSQRKESPKQVIGDVFSQMIYGSHPYGNSTLGSESSVKKLDLNAISAFYKKNFNPQNAALVVTGDINSEEWKKIIEKSFGDWKKGEKLEVLQQPQGDISKAKVLIVNKNDAIETTFRIGQIGIAANHPDRVAIDVINTILGGRFTSWLNDELRVNSGLTYGARSAFLKLKLSGMFYIESFTKKETTFEAIDLALKTYQQLFADKLDEKTLESAKSYIKGQFPPKFETADQMADFLVSMWAMGLDDSYINDFEKNVDQLDLKKAKEVIGSVFKKENLQFVLIGKASDIAEKSKKYGDVKIVEIESI